MHHASRPPTHPQPAPRTRSSCPPPPRARSRPPACACGRGRPTAGTAGWRTAGAACTPVGGNKECCGVDCILGVRRGGASKLDKCFPQCGRRHMHSKSIGHECVHVHVHPIHHVNMRDADGASPAPEPSSSKAGSSGPATRSPTRPAAPTAPAGRERVGVVLAHQLALFASTASGCGPTHSKPQPVAPAAAWRRRTVGPKPPDRTCMQRRHYGASGV